MSKWDNISLFKFQTVQMYQEKKDMPEIDKVLWSICTVFDYTEYQLDNMEPEQVEKLSRKITGIFESKLDPQPFKRIGKYFINYDISKITLGQYIELSFFLQQPIQNAHYTLASLSSLPLMKNKAEHHRKKANYFLKQSIVKVVGTVARIMEQFTAFNYEYKGLFGLDREVNGDVQNDVFNKRHGWIYSATQIAEHERISLEDTFRIPVRQAMNDLGYLKALAKYQAEQTKHQS